MSGSTSKHPMLMDPGIVAHRKGSGVDEADTATLAQLRMQVGHQRNQDGGHQLDKARIAHQRWKLAAQMTMYILDVRGFERAIVRLMKQNDNGHDLAGIHLS